MVEKKRLRKEHRAQVHSGKSTVKSAKAVSQSQLSRVSRGQLLWPVLRGRKK